MWSRAVGIHSAIIGDKTDMALDGLSKLFAEIKEKDKIDDLSVEYKKFAEWLRIEYATFNFHGRAR